MSEPLHDDHPHVPGPSLWPVGLAVGVVVLLVGLIISWWVAAVGAAVAIVFGALWVRDLTTGTELRLTTDHVRAFVRRVAAPVLLFLADDGPFARLPIYEEMTRLFADVEVVRMTGGHHLHLEGAEIEIARRIRGFLAV